MGTASKPATLYWRRRVVLAAMNRSRGALTNLHVALCKLAARADKAGGADMADGLRKAANHLSACLDLLVFTETIAEEEMRAQIAQRRADRDAART